MTAVKARISGFTEALSFAGVSAKDATDKIVTGLSKVQEEALKAQKQANDFDLEWEKIQSSERIAVFQIQAEVDIAAIQAGTEQIKAAFESVNTTIKSTGDTLSSLVKSLTEVGAGSGAGHEIISLLEDENKRRQEALDLQKQLVEAQVAYLNAVIDRLSQGDAQIQITADGLEPELEAFMFKILERIQMRASSEAQQFLLGLCPMLDVILSTKSFDVDGYVEISLEGSREAIIERTRRTSVVATLDGGVAVDDGGFSHGDRTLDVRVMPSRADLDILTYLVENYAQINCAMRDGFYTVVPQRLSSPSAMLMQLRILLVSRDDI